MSKAKCSNCELQDAGSPFWEDMCVDCNIMLLEAELSELRAFKLKEASHA